MNHILSYGGGVQSVALVCLVIQGRLPKPSLGVFADTGREVSTTMDYFRNHIEPIANFPIKTGLRELATVDLYSHKGKLLIPTYAKDGGMSPAYCSGEWKKYPIRRYLRSVGYGPKNPVRVWLGMSTDELGRVKPSGKKWCTNHFPLIFDLQLSRSDCLSVIAEMGLPVPHKSRCWMCPYMNANEWWSMPKADFAKAVAFDAAIRERNPKDGYVHPARVPLSEVDFSKKDISDKYEMECQTGFCFV